MADKEARCEKAAAASGRLLVLAFRRSSALLFTRYCSQSHCGLLATDLDEPDSNNTVRVRRSCASEPRLFRQLSLNNDV